MLHVAASYTFPTLETTEHNVLRHDEEMYTTKTHYVYNTDICNISL